MALFGKNENTTIEVKPSGSKSTTIITACMAIQGDIKGCGTIHVDGTIDGNLQIEDTIVIGKSGVVNGNISAKKIMISGTLKGTLNCDLLEVTQTGAISNKITAKKIVSDGKLDAIVVATEMIHITQNGRVETEKMQSKHVLVNGQIVGSIIASELLEINKEGQVKGEMTVKKLKVTEGGLMLGTMLTYEATNSVREVESTKNKSEEKEAVEKKK